MTPSPYSRRLPPDLHLGPVRLQVGDLARSVTFYETVLGLSVTRGGDGTATLAAAGAARPLVALKEHTGARRVAPHGRLGLYHFALLVPTRADLGRLLRHLIGLGLRPGSADHAVSEALYLSDPDGLGIEIYVDRPRSEWERRGDELFMTSAPIDVQGLLQAAGDAPWSAMPAGTTMGHVHLHVGDLGQAARFYETALGFDVMVRSYPGALFVSAGGYHHHLGLNTWAAGAPAPNPSDAQLLEWTLHLPDAASVHSAAERLAAHEYETERVADHDLLMADPWGTRLRLLS